MRVLLIIGLTFFSLGCGNAKITPDFAAPKCDAVEAHLVEVGCFNNEQCASLIQEIVRDQITNRMPDGADFKPYCDIALATGLLPVDCVMQAIDVPGILSCVTGRIL